ncbi:MAG: diguanylate cyclase [Lachnospiraceae bacterium]|nr:diguanylate cyclase [Lachnospiraceae bacterium]
MDDNMMEYGQIGMAMAKHFDSVYYVDHESGQYKEFVRMQALEDIGASKQGMDFFADIKETAVKCAHPEDIRTVLQFLDKDNMLKNLSHNGSYSAVFRLLLNGRVEHVRHIEILCEDKKHIICCLENIEAEIREKTDQERDLQSAKRMARLDELTGIRNKNAFMEYARSIDDMFGSDKKVEAFGIVMCDVNDLKVINDTRGHSFGDEAIQRASRMVCDNFKRSPVFRIGGDEFVAVLVGDDYMQREQLFLKLREESLANRRSRSGPVVASGMAVFDPDTDKCFDDVYKRADELMYENKSGLKNMSKRDGFANMEKANTPIPDERKRQLDGMFGALYTVAGGGYVYINDMKYDFSRWALPLIDDFGMESEYMYHADRIWQDYIHPDDLEVYRKAVDTAICGNAMVTPIYYRARRTDGTYVMLTTRAFILSDSNGDPEYFGGIIIQQ